MEEFKEEPDETSGQKLETKEKEVSADNDSITVFDEDILSEITKEKDHPDSKEEFQAGEIKPTLEKKISITQTAQLTDEPKEKMESVEVDKITEETSNLSNGPDNDEEPADENDEDDNDNDSF